MHKPFFSLIFTCYNLERYVRESLLSALAQDYDGDKELIVVDDASTDASAAIIEEVLGNFGGAWDRRFIRREVNGGVAAAVDDALASARGEWVILMDGDDIQLPDRCRKTAELIARHPQSVLINMSAELIDGDGHPYGRKSYAFASYESAPQELVCASPADRQHNYLTFDSLHIDAYGCTMAFRLDMYRRWGTLTEGMTIKRFLQDAPWTLRAYLSGEVLGSIQIACCYRAHATNIINREWKGGNDGVRKQEMFQSGYQSFFAATHRRMLADAERALSQPELTDWPTSGLKALVKHERKELRVAELRGDWWSIPWLHRVRRTIGTVGRLPWRMTFWPWLRLFPLTFVCALKGLKDRFSGRHTG